MEGSRIADSVKGCLELFRALASLDPPSPALTASYQTALMAIADDESRLKVWFANMDVRASENRSLRFRLRKASPLRDHVLRFLNDLSKFLEGALVIMKEGVVPWDEDEDEDEDDDFLNGGPDSLEDDGDNDEPPKSEMEQIADCISEFVDCIPQMSNSPRNPAPRDCSAASVPTDAPYESFDIQHVQAKFQKVDKILAQRLGSAITIRRQFFKYRESLKLAHGLDPKDQADGESTIANSIPSHAQSTEFDHTSLATHEDSVWDTDTCQASLTSSLADTDLLCIPPLPKGAESGHFECPFCFMTITATDIASWK
ncbi:uncharacterized protein TrAtP1_008248 [Trichoderma atroviride]|nr:hypothetical protein TrAtP1_008248 [Trichoderma atroviride]